MIMWKSFAFVCMALNIGITACLAEEPKQGLVDFPLHGFTIEPLEELSAKTYTLMFMYLPVEDGFSTNVNVRIEHYPDGLEKYIELSRTQSKLHKFEIVSETVEKDFYLVESKGTVLGNELHFYSKAIPKKDKIYLVTGTAKDSQWKKKEPKLKKAVDSFKLTP
jgi:hypothetical protein